MTVVPTLNYIEFAVKDMAQAKTFLASAFGWQFTDYGPEYCEFTDGVQKGGLFVSADVRPGGPMIVLGHEDLAAVQAQVEAAGGTITKETYSFPGGERFEFLDPMGYAWGVWRET